MQMKGFDLALLFGRMSANSTPHYSLQLTYTRGPELQRVLSR